MEYAGLFFEILLLVAGLYLYLFARGRINFKEASAREKAEAFRENNAAWLRLAALALMAIMLVNIFAHVRQLMAG